MKEQENIHIFWDFANAQPGISMSGDEIVRNIRTAAHEYGIIKSLRVYLNSSAGQTFSKFSTLRTELQASGAQLIDCPTNGHRNVAERMITVDMMCHAMDHSTSSTIFLITSDDEFAYAVATLRMRQYRVIVASTRGLGGALTSQASLNLSWSRDILRLGPGDWSFLPTTNGQEQMPKDSASQHNAETDKTQKGPSNSTQEFNLLPENIIINSFQPRYGTDSIFSFKEKLEPAQQNNQSEPFAKLSQPFDYVFGTGRPKQMRADSAPPATAHQSYSPPVSTVLYRTPEASIYDAMPKTPEHDFKIKGKWKAFPFPEPEDGPATPPQSRPPLVTTAPQVGDKSASEKAFFPAMQTAFDYLESKSAPNTRESNSTQKAPTVFSSSSTSPSAASSSGFSVVSAPPLTSTAATSITVTENPPPKEPLRTVTSTSTTAPMVPMAQPELPFASTSTKSADMVPSKPRSNSDSSVNIGVAQNSQTTTSPSSRATITKKIPSPEPVKATNATPKPPILPPTPTPPRLPPPAKVVQQTKQIPQHFTPLIAIMRSAGTGAQERSVIATRLRNSHPDVFRNTGLSKFKQYAASAEKHGIVTLGVNSEHIACMSLKPQYR